jgi:hypothetical protein
MTGIKLFKVTGYTDDAHGYSGLFSWWRGDKNRWHVIGHGQFTVSGYAVVDDFGNLVRVPS